MPFIELIVKVASRCNINCSYCYVYNMGNNSYLSQPKIMPKEVVMGLASKVKNHCVTHKMKDFRFVLHGGEPLLAGKEFFKYFTSTIRQALEPTITPYFIIQTNGVLIDYEWAELLHELHISIGISLDGPQHVNDRQRVDHQGEGTYQRVIKGLNEASKYPNFSGLLCVIDPTSDPIEVYTHFKSLEKAKNIDLLLPDNNYDKLPPLLDEGAVTPDRPTPYADWLIKIFDLWFYEESPKIKIRIFNLIIRSILGGKVSFDGLGNETCDFLIIETNGDMESSDSLKICGDSFTKGNYNIQKDELDDALQLNLVDRYHFSREKLCTQCQICPVKQVCGGGFLPTRFSTKNGFDNPTVYCADLIKLITHIQNCVIEQLPDNLCQEFDIEPIQHREVIDHLLKAHQRDLIHE